MRRILCLLSILALGVFAMTRDDAPAAAADPASGSLRHVVLFKFKDGTSPEQVQQVVDAFRALPKKIDAIQDFEYGTDVSVENKQQGFTHCFLVTFRDEQGRDAYLPHPAHKEFGTLVRPLLDKVLVFDFRPQR
ncbi:MAG TPA: Dabb family protein [Pirellulales bacterium]|jgi:hypothetical protein|nr:Dabb family protein [Pirellulales bacterium]